MFTPGRVDDIITLLCCPPELRRQLAGESSTDPKRCPRELRRQLASSESRGATVIRAIAKCYCWQPARLRDRWTLLK